MSLDFVSRLNPKRSGRHVARQIGTAAGSTLMLHAPTCQVVDVQRVDTDGMAYQQITAEARNDSETTASGALQRSNFRLSRC